MTIKENIIGLLKRKELTSIQISSELQIPKKNLWVYLKTLVDEGKIERTTDKKPFKYKAVKTYDENMNNRLLHDKIDKLEKIKEGYMQFNNLFESFMKKAKNIIKNSEFNTFKKMIQENIDINTIKKINEELI